MSKCDMNHSQVLDMTNKKRRHNETPWSLSFRARTHDYARWSTIPHNLLIAGSRTT